MGDFSSEEPLAASICRSLEQQRATAYCGWPWMYRVQYVLVYKTRSCMLCRWA